MRKLTTIGLLWLLVSSVCLGQNLDLKRITQGAYRAEGISGVVPAADGESYTKVSDDWRSAVEG